MEKPLPFPTHTQRLTLRRLARTDIDAMVPLIGDIDIARMTATIPHPYSREDAEKFLDLLEANPGRPIVAITLRDGPLVGVVGLNPEASHDRAEMGYWIGKPYWGNGYATEAAAELLRIAFEHLGFNRIVATCFPHNPGSERVLQKIGLLREGHLRQHVKKWGKYEDLVTYGLLRSDWAGTHNH